MPHPLFKLTPTNYFKSRTAIVTGDVTIGPQSSLWFGAILRGDVAPISLGSRVNVQDNAVIHCDSGVPNTIEDDVTIGHAAVCHGAHIGRGSLIGMSATLLGKSRVGSECLIAAGALLPPNFVVPDRMLAIGSPAKIARPVRPEELEYMRWLTTHYVEQAKRHIDGVVREVDPD